LGVGVNKVVLNTNMLAEIKEAITRQDVRDLKSEKMISVKENSGRKSKEIRKTKRKAGSRKKRVKNRKAEYVQRTRKLRRHIKNLKNKNLISNEHFKSIRKKIRAKSFKDLSHLKTHIREELKWEHWKEEEANIKQIIKQE